MPEQSREGAQDMLCKRMKSLAFPSIIRLEVTMKSRLSRCLEQDETCLGASEQRECYDAVVKLPSQQKIAAMKFIVLQQEPLKEVRKKQLFLSGHMSIAAALA